MRSGCLAVVAAAMFSSAATAQEFAGMEKRSLPDVRVYAPPPKSMPCSGGQATLVRGRALPPIFAALLPVGGTLPDTAPRELLFDITPEGRPVSIRPGSLSPPRFSPSDDDLEAQLAAFAFAPTTAGLKGCRFRAEQSITPISALDKAALRRFAVNSGPLGHDQLRAVAGQTGDDCYVSDARLRPSVTRHPDTEALPKTAGERDWVLVRYDVDEAGETTSVSVDQSTGNKAFDEAAVKAIDGSSFYNGGLKGCRATLHLPPAPLPAPARPDIASYRQPGDTCRNSDAQKVLENAQQYYPGAFNRRALEGWAVLRFDVAPWGEVGPAKILAAEPAQAFGRASQRLIRSARLPESEGAVGCNLLVIFKLPPSADAASSGVQAK